MSKRAARSMRQFLGEADELVRALRGNLVLLEEATADPRVLDETFRVVHTLKGIAEPFRRVRVGEVAHSLESLLDAMRMGRVATTDDVRTLLDEAVDVCQSELRAASGGSRMELDRFVEFLERLQHAANAPAVAQDPVALPGVPLAGLTEYQEHRARDNLRRGRGLYKVSASFDLVEARDGLLRLGESIGPVGEVIAHIPLAASDDDTLAFEVLVAAADGDEVERRLRPAGASGVIELAAPRASKRSPSGPVPAVSGTIRVDLDRLEDLLSGLSDARRRANALAGGEALAERLRGLEGSVLELCAVPLESVFDKLRRIGRAIIRGEGTRAKLTMSGGDVSVDRSAADDLSDALLHLLRNALDHGIEPPDVREAAGKPERGSVELLARAEDARLVVTVRDDGHGIDADEIADAAVRRGLASKEQVEELDTGGRLRLIFLPGMSTRDEVSELSGRGVGMDVVKSKVAALGGSLDIDSRPGHGTEVVLWIPRRFGDRGVRDGPDEEVE